MPTSRRPRHRHCTGWLPDLRRPGGLPLLVEARQPPGPAGLGVAGRKRHRAPQVLTRNGPLRLLPTMLVAAR
jgi:hypothetical protein